MRWNRSELERLYPILERVSSDLFPVDGKQILVLCSGNGEVVFWLAEMMETGKVTGLELDPEALNIARRSAREMGLEGMVEFKAAEKERIPLPDESFDALVSDFIVYPTAAPTEIGQAEMARVLKPGGRMVLTDVIVTRPLPQEVRAELQSIGLDYLCEGTPGDFRKWMSEAGLVNIQTQDLTSTIRNLWESRREADQSASHWMAYSYLLENNQFNLGKSIFYLHARGDKLK